MDLFIRRSTLIGSLEKRAGREFASGLRVDERKARRE